MTVMGEAKWIGFRTRVRFPPGPLKQGYPNTESRIEVSVFRNVFAVTVPFRIFQEETYLFEHKASYTEIRAWVRKKYGLCVSNLNVSQTKAALGLSRKPYKGREAAEGYYVPRLKPEKAEAITDALKHFGMYSDES